MTPQFAKAIDPIFLYVLDLLERINRSEEVSTESSRAEIIALLDRAEATVGRGQDWDLAKYAIVSWIDELLVETPWDGRDWWSNNVLEVDTFNTRLCYEQFFVKGQEASALERRDALEVFYVCVVLGFRGLYRDTKSSEPLLRAHDLPLSLNIWAKQTAMTIRLGQGRVPLAAPSEEIDGATPLRARDRVAWSCLAVVVLSVMNVVFYMLFFRD